ncbi:MAG: hypothetical protein M1819_003965 [Sarea resinae]|nr:MAG: hypothetical protein M1819_003965 [Sarea resinae]
MASHLGALRIPQCLSCVRQLSGTAGAGFSSALRQQIRGKKKLARPTSSIRVRLLQDVTRYGRQGAIVPIAAGRMRNRWYPEGMAEYVTEAQLKHLQSQEVPMERDFNFRPGEALQKAKVEIEAAAQVKPRVKTVAEMDIEILTPDRATQVVSNLLPSKIEFYRTPIPAPKPEKPAHDTSRAPSINSAAADFAAASEPLPKTEPLGIYGSVSTGDIASSIKAFLDNNEEASKVNLSAEDISFIGGPTPSDNAEVDRVKHLGDFEIEIKIKGAEETIRRVVVVRPQA